MQTENVNTAANESSEPLKITVSQFADLVCWVLHSAEKRVQPVTFIPPVGALALRMASDTSGEVVTLWVQDGWPMAVEEINGQYTQVVVGMAWHPETEHRRIVPDENLSAFVLGLFHSPQGESLITDWLYRHTDYTGGELNGFVIPKDTVGNYRTTGYLAPVTGRKYHVQIPGNYFDGELSADATGILATLMILNTLSWTTSDMGIQYDRITRSLVNYQDALKDFISVTKHPEACLIYRAID